MTVTVGAGLGGFSAIVAQPTYGNTFIAPTRTLGSLKSNKPTHNPHIVQGGPYLRGGTTLVDLGSAHVQTWLDANGTMTGDFVNTGMALLLATAFGSSGTLTQVGTTTAYQLGGASGITPGAPDKNNGGTSGCCFDMQIAVPRATDGTLFQFNYHSCMITKAEWVFDRTGLVTFSYDWDAQTVEETSALITPAYPAAPVPFSFSTSSSLFKIGTLGSEAAVDGARKVTFTMEHRFANDRIYLGNTSKDLLVSNGLIDITVAIDFDYTTNARTVMETFLTNTPQSIIATSVGNAIGSSGQNDTFTLQATNAFILTGGEPLLDGPDLVKNTATFKGTIDTAGDAALKAFLTTADTAF